MEGQMTTSPSNMEEMNLEQAIVLAGRHFTSEQLKSVQLEISELYGE